jgi:hypothetical protein
MMFVISLQKHIKKVPSVVILILLRFHRSILTYIVLQNWMHMNNKPEGGISLCSIQILLYLSIYGNFVLCWSIHHLSFVPKYRCAATYTAGWEEKPVHENSFTVIVRVIGQQTMPFVLLFTTTVSRTSLSLQLAPVK